MAASLFAWLFNSVELTCLPAALKALILHSFFLFSYVNALKGCFLFFGPPEVLFAFFLLSTSPTAACSQSIFHQRSSLKTVHQTVFLTVGFKSLRFLYVTKKQKTPQLWCLLFFWPTRRDLNPHSPESESVALSNCATDGYSAVFSYGFLYLINLKALPKLHTVLPVHSAILRVYL